MLKRYFYSLLYNYLSIYIRQGDTVVAVDPDTDRPLRHFPGAHIVSSEEKKGGALKALGSDRTMEAITDINPDYILLDGSIQYKRDIQAFLSSLHSVCPTSARLIITYYSSLWKPLIQLATLLRIRRVMPESNWLSHEDMLNLLLLSDFETIQIRQHILLPLWIPGLSNFVNRYLAPLPFFRLFTVLNILVARPLPEHKPSAGPAHSVSVVVPARNEAENIEKIVQRIPRMGPDDELIFIEGNSTDRTWETINNMQQQYGTSKNIVIARQDGIGKGDAVRKGFSLATRDILMILDADMTVPPEDLPRFYTAIVSGKGEFINGSRLVYPMEKGAMRFFNILGNKFFAQAFSYLLGQRFKDTLCGTKTLTRASYNKLSRHRAYFGDFDPFGDFDLIFGAARLGLKIVEIPIRYRERVYGATNISRWRHGAILFRMLIFAARKIKFI